MTFFSMSGRSLDVQISVFSGWKTIFDHVRVTPKPRYLSIYLSLPPYIPPLTSKCIPRVPFMCCGSGVILSVLGPTSLV